MTDATILHEVPDEVLLALLHVALPPALDDDDGPPASQELLHRCRRDPALALAIHRELDRRLPLECALSGCPLAQVEARLVDARRRADGRATACLLWHACQQEGPAWARLRARAHSSLLHIALCALAAQQGGEQGGFEPRSSFADPPALAAK